MKSHICMGIMKGIYRFEKESKSKHFYDSSKKYLAGLGIKVICSERVPKLEEIRKDMATFMKKGKNP